jgi:DNA-3-methyladenine glycosylase I
MAGFGVPLSRPTVITSSDSVTRCSWATESGLDLTGYHDGEWGTPTRDPSTLFEALTLTYFENGLSWATVFGKRDAFRLAFRGFAPAAVAALTPADLDALMADRSIVRNRAKIEATVHNAGLVSSSPSSFVEMVWAHRPTAHHALRVWADGRMDSPESRHLSRELKSLGYRLVGPVVVHSFMQTVGIENGHFDGCFRAPSADPGRPAPRSTSTARTRNSP